MAGSFKITPGGTEESVARLEALGRLMDGALVLPGTNIRLGLDAIIGLVPVVGDLIGGHVDQRPGSADGREDVGRYRERADAVGQARHAHPRGHGTVL